MLPFPRNPAVIRLTAIRLSVIAVALAVGIPASASSPGAPPAGGPPVEASEPTPDSAEARALRARFSPEKMDRSADPRVDFGKFAAGRWYAETTIPEDKSRWGGFEELSAANWARIRELVEAAAREPGPPGSVRQKVGDFFAAAMDTTGRETRGLEPIAGELQAIADAADLEQLMPIAARLHRQLGDAFFSMRFSADAKRSEYYGFYLVQGGMTLPSKEYYIAPKFARERWELVGHWAKLLELAGEPKASAFTQAERVFALEKAMAENAKLPVDLRDPLANYHRMPLEDAFAAYPHLPLRSFVTALGLPAGVTDVIVGQPDFLAGLSALLRDEPLDTWKAYLRCRLLGAAAPYLSEPYEQESFRFHSTVLHGTPVPEPRWQRAARALDQALGEALGQLYVEKHFPPAARARMQEMIDNIKAVMRERLETVTWMSEPTRRKALAKFDRFTPMIGHPEIWRDYRGVEIRRDDFFGNVVRAAAAEKDRRIQRVGQPVDKREWAMSPPTVNAYFSSTTNQIVFPAGILQPPFFHSDLDDAVNYGAIGAVIGHEITHGFDDQGRRFDADGNLTDWWTPEDAANFRSRAQKLVEQYNSYWALPQVAVNGQLSLGENIADLGGTSIALEALQRSLRGKPAPPKIDGLTAEQRFFVSWAQLWRTMYRDDAMRLQVARGPHAPGNFRATGPLVNQQAFFDAFGIREGDPMWRSPEVRARIW